MSNLLVNRCICHNKTFTEIKEYAEQEEITEVSELQAMDFCSNNCRMCEPYLELMFETGETAFEPGAYLKAVSK
tara:strand:+ start:36442 stop:36663 length:222 start_codon:yes stop_codon:yes gene_type:complete